MAELSRDIVAEVVEACRAGAGEAAVAFGRVVDAEVQLSVGEPGSVNTQALPESCGGPGLAIVLTVGGSGAVVFVPESSGLLPSWYTDPDPTGREKLAGLGQELGRLLLPKPYVPDESAASNVPSLSEALVRGGVSDGAAMVPLELQGADGARATAQLVWPAVNPAAVIEHTVTNPSPETAAEPQATSEPPAQAESDCQPAPEPKPGGGPKPGPGLRGRTVDDLPNYTRSLLRIGLPVVVTLARKRRPLGRILELGPGAIIQFEKSCEEMLELEVGGHPIATGEAVKVGDKFGLRINAMILPEERFLPVHRDKQQQQAAGNTNGLRPRP